MTEAKSNRAPLLPVVLGFALAGLMILLLGVWSGRREARVPLAIELRSPSRDTTVEGPVRVQFQTTLPLRLGAGGWGSGAHHLHALLDSTELMPGPADLKVIGPNLYEWVLPAPQRTTRFQLVWALPNHARLAAGASDTIRIAPRPSKPQPLKVSDR